MLRRTGWSAFADDDTDGALTASRLGNLGKSLFGQNLLTPPHDRTRRDFWNCSSDHRRPLPLMAGEPRRVPATAGADRAVPRLFLRPAAGPIRFDASGV